jgi:sugar phosphate isomerase/epimerase
MNTSRREFIRNSTLALAGTALIPKRGLGFPLALNNTTLAVQLYCVRDEMQEDPLGSLRQLADMGFTHVEHADYVDQKFYGWNAKEFKKVLDNLGLKIPSGHTVLKLNHWDEAIGDFTDEWKKLIDDAAYIGQRYVISPYMESSVYNTYATFMQFMEIFNRSGELCQKYGMKFGYHNHDFEFSKKLEGETLWDLIMNHTDTGKVVLQLDMGNMFIAGAKAKDLLAKYPGRFDTIHVKDEIRKEDGEYESCVLGKGLIEVKKTIDLARDTGTTLFIIEQESYQGKKPMERMKENLDTMHSWGY